MAQLSMGNRNSTMDTFATVIRKNHTARDITSTFNKASRALEIGQLVKDENFTLYESVQALEIMDPKMDSGYLAPGEILVDYYDVGQDLLPEEVLGIMDQMMCYEMAWHQGYPLAQTLFTSHHLGYLIASTRPPHTPPQFPGNSVSIGLVLRAFCVGVIKSCDMTIELITSQLYFEEEDFATNTYKLDLLTDVADDQALDLLDQAVAWLEEPDNDWVSENAVRLALILRLRWRREFLSIFLPPPEGEVALGRWALLLALVPGFETSSKLGLSVANAFSVKLQRKLASTVPPRPAIQLSFEEAYREFSQLHVDVQEAMLVLQYDKPYCHDRWIKLTTFLWQYSARLPPPSVFARAVLQSQLLVEGSLGDDNIMRTIMKEHLETHSVIRGQIGLEIPSSLWDVETPEDFRYQAARKVDRYTSEGAPEFISILRALCQNRCRVRRCLINVLSDFRALFQDARKLASLDSLANAVQLGTENESLLPNEQPLERLPENSAYLWTLTHAITQSIYSTEIMVMEWILTMAFEQDIYLPTELTRMYWIRFQIGRARINATDGLTTTFETYMKSQADRLRGWTHDSWPSEPKYVASYQVRRFADCKLSQVLSHLYVVLMRLDLLERPAEETEAMLELRLRPMHPHSDEFKTIVNWDLLDQAPCWLMSMDDLFKMVDAKFSDTLSWLNTIRRDNARSPDASSTQATLNATKSCVAARLILPGLQKAYKQYGESIKDHVTVKIPAPEQRDHRAWVVPRISIRD